MNWSVAFLPKARAEMTTIGRWWNQNRRESPRLFREEIHGVLSRLREQPELGERVEGAIRRLLLPRTRYYLYYRVVGDARTVIVLSIWHTARGSGPAL